MYLPPPRFVIKYLAKTTILFWLCVNISTSYVDNSSSVNQADEYKIVFTQIFIERIIKFEGVATNTPNLLRMYFYLLGLAKK